MGEPESVPVRDTEGVAVPDGELEGVVVTDIVAVPDFEGVEDGVLVRELVSVPVGDFDGVPEELTEAVVELDWLGVGETGTDTPEEREGVGDGVTRGVSDREPERVPEFDGDCVAVPLPVGETVGVVDKEEPADAVPVSDGVTLTVGVRDRDGVLERDRVAVAEGLRVRLDVGERVGVGEICSRRSALPAAWTSASHPIAPAPATGVVSEPAAVDAPGATPGPAEAEAQFVAAKGGVVALPVAEVGPEYVIVAEASVCSELEAVPALNAVGLCACAQLPNAAARSSARSSRAPPGRGAERPARTIVSPTRRVKLRAPHNRTNMAVEKMPPLAPAMACITPSELGKGVRKITPGVRLFTDF